MRGRVGERGGGLGARERASAAAQAPASPPAKSHQSKTWARRAWAPCAASGSSRPRCGTASRTASPSGRSPWLLFRSRAAGLAAAAARCAAREGEGRRPFSGARCELGGGCAGAGNAEQLLADAVVVREGGREGKKRDDEEEGEASRRRRRALLAARSRGREASTRRARSSRRPALRLGGARERTGAMISRRAGRGGARARRSLAGGGRVARGDATLAV